MGKLGDICTNQSSNIKQGDLETLNGKYPIYGASGLIKYVDFYIQDKPYIGIVKDGAGVGRVMCLPPYSSVIGTMQYIIPKENVNVEYLAYAMEYMNLSKYYSGATIPHIYFRDYKNEPIPNYAIKDQERIAHIIKKVNELSSLRKEQLQKLDDLVKARFVEMLGDPVSNPKKWAMIELGELTSVGSSKRIFEREYVSEGIPFYRTKEIVELSKGISISTELYITNERFTEIKEQFGAPKVGDLLISAVGTIGVIWIVDGKNEFYFKDGNIIRVNGSAKFDSVYMKTVLEYLIAEYKKQMSAGTAYAALTISGLAKMKVYDVPIELQKQFAAFVSQIDKSKLSIQQGLERLETLKKSLMQQYFG